MKLEVAARSLVEKPYGRRKNSCLECVSKDLQVTTRKTAQTCLASRQNSTDVNAFSKNLQVTLGNRQVTTRKTAQTCLPSRQNGIDVNALNCVFVVHAFEDRLGPNR